MALMILCRTSLGKTTQNSIFHQVFLRSKCPVVSRVWQCWKHTVSAQELPAVSAPLSPAPSASSSHGAPSRWAVWLCLEAFRVANFSHKLFYYLALHISAEHKGGVSYTNIYFPRTLTKVAVNQHMKKEIQKNQQVGLNSFLKEFAVLPSLFQTLGLQFS